MQLSRFSEHLKIDNPLTVDYTFAYAPYRSIFRSAEQDWDGPPPDETADGVAPPDLSDWKKKLPPPPPDGIWAGFVSGWNTGNKAGRTHTKLV